MRQLNSPLAHHGHQIAIAELETQIPADAQHHDLLIKMAALEQFFHRNESHHLSITPRVRRVCTRAVHVTVLDRSETNTVAPTGTPGSAIPGILYQED